MDGRGWPSEKTKWSPPHNQWGHAREEKKSRACVVRQRYRHQHAGDPSSGKRLANAHLQILASSYLSVIESRRRASMLPSLLPCAGSSGWNRVEKGRRSMGGGLIDGLGRPGSSFVLDFQLRGAGPSGTGGYGASIFFPFGEP